MGFREIVVTGGEPLAHPNIGTILAALARQLPVALMTNGLALKRHAELVIEHADSIFVSLDAADDETYLRLRGVRGLQAVRDGIRAIAGKRVHARVTVWSENVDQLEAIADLAKEAGCRELSYLACDVSSGGFGDRSLDRGHPPRPEQLPALRDAFRRLTMHPILRMSPYAVQRVIALSAGQRAAPQCLAPFTSGVVTPTGGWNHCFFIPTPVTVEAGLAMAIRTSRPQRRSLTLSKEAACQACVCWRG
jgi:MoaA/NifB/PqqE/SkfB family radical SAM enzyme